MIQLPDHTPNKMIDQIRSFDQPIQYNDIISEIPNNPTTKEILNSGLPYLKLDIEFDYKKALSEFVNSDFNLDPFRVELYGSNNWEKIAELEKIDPPIRGWDREKWLKRHGNPLKWLVEDNAYIKDFITNIILGVEDELFKVVVMCLNPAGYITFHWDRKVYAESGLCAFYLPLQLPSGSIFCSEKYGVMDTAVGDVILFNPYTSYHGAINGSMSEYRLVLAFRVDFKSEKMNKLVSRSYDKYINENT